jgi:hypothetical protein
MLWSGGDTLAGAHIRIGTMDISQQWTGASTVSDQRVFPIVITRSTTFIAIGNLLVKPVDAFPHAEESGAAGDVLDGEVETNTFLTIAAAAVNDASPVVALQFVADTIEIRRGLGPISGAAPGRSSPEAAG